MNKIIIYTTQEGTLFTVHPAPEMFDSNSMTRQLVPELQDKTDEEILQWIINKDIPTEVSHRVMDFDELPSQDLFRDAWKDTGTSIEVDIPKAQEIKLAEFRRIRQPLLASLDIEYQRALEENNEENKAEVVTKKQALRDVTKVTLPTDVQELKEFIPDVLKPQE